MKTSTSNNKYQDYIFLSLGIIFIFLIWFISSSIVDNEIILPKISEVFKSLISLFKDKNTYIIILYTFLRVLISLVLGLVIGIIFGVLSFEFRWFHSFITPFIKIMRVLPIASIILVLLIMFGQKTIIGDLSYTPIIVSLLLIIPISFEAVYKGLINIDRDLIDVARLDSKNKWELIKNSYIPLISNEIEISIFQSIGLGIKAMVMAEYISQTNYSIGRALLDSKTFLLYDKVYAWTIILIILCLLIELSIIIYKRRKKI